MSTRKGRSIKKKGRSVEETQRVRSKSEKMIADKLFFMNIPYRYEYPLEIDNVRTIYPDFTILNVSERKEYRLEHFGKMDDLGYAERTVRKINTYTRNGYYAGENILYTYETQNMPIDMIGFCVAKHLAEQWHLNSNRKVLVPLRIKYCNNGSVIAYRYV